MMDMMGEQMMSDAMAGFGWAWMVLWGLVALGLVVLIVLAAAWLAGNLGQPGQAEDGGSSDRGTDTPREALERRYAGGEISRDEYLQTRSDLTEHRT